MNHDLLSAGIDLVEVRWSTYHPISGHSSSSSSSSSMTATTLWHGVYGTVIDDNSSISWDGISAVLSLL